jgi:hypothetical protein
LDALGRQTLDLWHDMSLTEQVRQQVKSVSALEGEDLTQPSDCIAVHSIRAGVIILKATSACPPKCRSVRAHAAVDASQPGGAFLAFAVSEANASLSVSEQGLASNKGFWWSGWIAAGAPGGRLELPVTVGEPAQQAFDLYFLCKSGEHDLQAGGKIIWDSVQATISVNDTLSAAAAAFSQPATPVPLRLLQEGILLSSNPFPFPVFVPGHPTLLHPVPGKVSLVLVAGAVPPGTKGIRSVVSLERAGSHPVEFAVWIRPSSAPATNGAELTEADPFSGWLSVTETFRRHSFTLNLREATAGAMDLYLATRVVGYADAYHCHAVWHELLMLQ